MRHHENVDLTDGIVRGDKLRLDVPGQVSAAEELETAKCRQQADTGRVVGLVFGHRFVKFRERIRIAGVLDDFATGRHHFHRKRRAACLDRKTVSGFHRL